MSNDSLYSGDSKQYENTAKMIMSTYYTLSLKKNGVTANEIADYLRERYGDVWRVSTLVAKAQDTLRRSALLGFLEKRGDRYMMIDKRLPRVRQRVRQRVGQRRSHRRRCKHVPMRRKPYYRYHRHCDSCQHSKSLNK